MKKALFALGMVAISVPSFAQDHKHVDYTISAFDGYNQLGIANKKAVTASQRSVQAAFPGFYAATDKLTGQVRDIYGKAMVVPGMSIADKMAYLMDNNLKQLGISKSEWRLQKITNAPHASFAYYEQYINGRKVVFSQLMARFTKDGRLQRISLKSYGQPEGITGTNPAVTRQATLDGTALTADMNAIMNVQSKNVDTEWEWFPVPGNYGYTLQPAWHYTVSGLSKHDEYMPVTLTGYVNAMTGEVLYRINEVKEEVDLVVKGNVYKDNMVDPPSDQPLANLAIVLGGNTNYTNDTGYYVDNSTNPPATLDVKLQGKWSTVRVGGASGTIPSVSTTVNGNGTTFVYPPTSPAGVPHINAYYHTNRMHDFMKQHYPDASGFTGLDNSLTTVVELSAAGGGCNAFYNGASINFYEENSGCNSFANIGDVVYHEYGHGINGRFYGFIKGSGGMSNGGLNEGYADVWALSVTKDPILGRKAFKGGGNIRTYNATPKRYPMEWTGEVHDNGEIIAGAWWDFGVNINSVDTMTILFAKTLYDVPDGPEGTELEVYQEVLRSALINDDNDADLANGTPHMKELVDAFARHGIFMMGDALLEHTELDNREQENTEIPVTANLVLTEPAFFQEMKLVYRNRAVGTWDTLAMANGGTTATGGVIFNATIPGQPARSIIEYYFVVYDITGTGGHSFPNRYNASFDAAQVTIPYQFAIGVRKIRGTSFEEASTDWSLAESSDNATGGDWIHAVPIQSTWRPFGSNLSLIAQTGADHTSGAGKCLVTGNGLSATTSYNSADVDNGKTTATTPALDLTAFNKPIIEYYRWHANDRGGRNTNPRTDLWRVQIRDTGSVLWRTVESTYQADYEWRRRIFAVDEYLTSSKQVQMRFIATDAVNSSKVDNGQNNVEAAIDDFFIYEGWATGVAEQPQRMDLQVYPNPADNTVTVTLPIGVAGSISLFDLTGRALFTQTMDAGTVKYTFNTASLADGQYMLIMQTNNKTIQAQKIVVKH